MGHDITEPLRLAQGSHSAGSGMGCAMNVISWEQGDVVITDYPSCADRRLAALVQAFNDTYCDHTASSLLCAPCSVDVLALAHRTVGTAGVTNDQHWWLLAADVLDARWGLACRSLAGDQLEGLAKAMRAVGNGAPRTTLPTTGRNLDDIAHQVFARVDIYEPEYLTTSLIEVLQNRTKVRKHRLAMMHGAFDAFDRITQHTTETPAQSVVDAAVARMREVSPA